MAGHDYVDALYFRLVVGGQNWSISEDGTNNGVKAVKSAVDEFFLNRGVLVNSGREEVMWWPSWFILKPCMTSNIE